MSKIQLTAERLRWLLHYDPLTGAFTWLIARSNCIKVGEEAGTPCDGYLTIRIDGRRYRAHRLAWLYMTGEWPKVEIDHWDTNRANNRWVNLREATRSQNTANSPKRSDNVSGFKGVSWNTKRGRWLAQIQSDGRGRFLGYFDAPENAHAAYCVAATETFGEFARVA